MVRILDDGTLTERLGSDGRRTGGRLGRGVGEKKGGEEGEERKGFEEKDKKNSNVLCVLTGLCRRGEWCCFGKCDDDITNTARAV